MFISNNEEGDRRFPHILTNWRFGISGIWDFAGDGIASVAMSIIKINPFATSSHREQIFFESSSRNFAELAGMKAFCLFNSSELQ